MVIPSIGFSEKWRVGIFRMNHHITPGDIGNEEHDLYKSGWIVFTSRVTLFAPVLIGLIILAILIGVGY